MAASFVILSANSQTVIRSALRGARKTVKQAGGKQNIIVPRILSVLARVGGFLPFLGLLFAGLSVTGALAGGAVGIVKADNDRKAVKKKVRRKSKT